MPPWAGLHFFTSYVGGLGSTITLGDLPGHYAAEKGTVKEKLYRRGAVDPLIFGRQGNQASS